MDTTASSAELKAHDALDHDQPMLADTSLGASPPRLWLSQKILSWLLVINTVGPGMSVPLYWLIPHGTVWFFGGDESSDSAAYWCQIVGAGDFMFAFICAAALLTTSGAIRRLVVRAIGWYSLFHFGAFLRGSWQPGAFPAMPPTFVAGVTSMLVGSQVMHFYYGYFVPVRALSFDARGAIPCLRWCSPKPTPENQ